MPSLPKAPADPIDSRLVRKLADILTETGLSEIEIEHGGLKIRVAKTLTAAPVQHHEQTTGRVDQGRREITFPLERALHLDLELVRPAHFDGMLEGSNQNRRVDLVAHELVGRALVNRLQRDRLRRTIRQ